MRFGDIFWEQESMSNFRATIKPPQFNGFERFEILIWEEDTGWTWAFAHVGGEILDEGSALSLDIAMYDSVEALWNYAEWKKAHPQEDD